VNRRSGFTLIELVVAMAVFGLLSLGIFGVLVLGARSAASGERVSEQARRFRMAAELMARQVAATDAIKLPRQDQEGLGDEDDGSAAEPFFFGNSEEVEFVTTAPQRPDASGMAIVHYWMEDGMLLMSEKPVFSAYGTDEGLGGGDEPEETLGTTLLYDVESVIFSYQRESDSDEWIEVWDAVEEENLPACIRVEILPSAAGGPDLYHEMPVMVATFNQINDADDFSNRKMGKKAGAPRQNDTNPPPDGGGDGGDDPGDEDLGDEDDPDDELED
jgi:prepilin-type N-terminal cleavage/methylation domain-containing protein